MEKYLNQIIHGDCLEVMKQMPDKCVDLVLTDPPYGIKMDKGFEGFGGFGKPIARRRYEDDEWDSERPSKEYFNEIQRVGRKVIIFGGNFFADLLPRSSHWLVWDKLNTMPTFSDCELMWTNVDRKSVMKYVHQYNGLLGKEDWRAHPTQKPVNLIEKILADYSDEGETVLDPFGGSCTTAVACINLKRNYICIEKEEKYIKICHDRIGALTKQLF